MQLLPENAARRGLTLFNDGGTACYVLYGAGTVSSTNFNVKIAAGGYYEMPQPILRSRVTAIWDATASASIYVTEIV